MDYGGGDHKRQTRAAYGWLVVGQSVGAGLAYGLQAVRPLWLWQKRCCSWVLGLWHYTSVNMPLPLKLELQQTRMTEWHFTATELQQCKMAAEVNWHIWTALHDWRRSCAMETLESRAMTDCTALEAGPRTPISQTEGAICTTTHMVCKYASEGVVAHLHKIGCYSVPLRVRRSKKCVLVLY